MHAMCPDLAPQLLIAGLCALASLSWLGMSRFDQKGSGRGGEPARCLHFQLKDAAVATGCHLRWAREGLGVAAGEGKAGVLIV